MTPKIIFQDKNIIILDKPSGVITISDISNVETIATLVAKEFSIPAEISIVHRLDKDTSGVIVVAKKALIKQNLQDQFKDRKVKKEYLVLVHGKVEESGIINAEIARNPGDPTKFIALRPARSGAQDLAGRPALPAGRFSATKYEPLERLEISEKRLVEIFPDLSKKELNKLSAIHYSLFTLVSAKPLTGRTHQIRVHLKYINHPIVSDVLYSGRKIYKLDLMWCPRLFLHASKIGFYHPESGEWMEFESPIPEDLKSTLNKLT